MRVAYPWVAVTISASRGVVASSRRDSSSGEGLPSVGPSPTDEEPRILRGVVHGGSMAKPRGIWAADGFATAKSSEPPPCAAV